MDNPATRTAIGPMVIVALDQYEPRPLVHDPVAARILPGATRPIVAVARWRAVRRWVMTMSEKQIPGLWAEMLCRKRHADDVVSQAVESDGVGSVVILGAGMDTRPYRLPALAATTVYEVDLPSNVDRKRARLTAIYGQVPDHVTLVPTDFESQDVAETLAAAGYDAGRPTVFVWEAVTQYLTERGVRDTFAFLAKAPAGSTLVFTYVRQDFLTGQALYGADAAYRDFVVKRGLWKFGLDPDVVGDFLAGYGWELVEQLGPSEYTTRYLEPNGRDLPVTPIERSVSARKA